MKTAVEWLCSQIYTIQVELEAGNTHLKNKIEQAKQMEKEQIKDSYEKGKKYKKPIKDSNPIWLNSKPYK